MYIHGMRMAARFATILTVVALVSPWVPALLCARPGAETMPCCKTQAPCHFQMTARGCCSIERAPATPGGAAGTLPPPSGSEQIQRPRPAHVDLLDGDLVARFVFTRVNRLWYPPAHDDSAPLFLRNVSILR
jgi:hypothetical protein